jgi:uncharacterized protein YndB with AHSA1/START domain
MNAAVMNRTVSIAPVSKSITVNASQKVAFETYTARMGAWWPKDHHIGPSKMTGVLVEPREGGRLCEVGEDGSQTKWGTMLVWDPHQRVVYTWQITSQWQPSPDDSRDVHSEVEVRFIAKGPATTLVELEHRNFERMGAEAGKTMHDGVERGWPGLLEMFAKVAAA